MIVTDQCRRVLRKVLARLAAGAVAVAFACAAAAQNQPTPQLGAAPGGEPQQQVGAPPEAARQTPGLFGAIGRWLDNSAGGVAAGWSSARDAVGNIGTQATDAAKGVAGVARDAAATVARVPAGSLVSGRAHCVRTASGGPDCAAAAETLCRVKGYSSGTSLHIQSAQKCPVWGWVSGEKPVGKCSTETYVTSAMCR